MGTIPGLATVVTTLLGTLVVLGLVILGLTLGVVVPALAEARADRRSRHLGIPAYYRLAPTH